MKTILVIDDERPIRENIEEFFDSVGYQVISAENGSEGVQKAIVGLPDLIICDISMPIMDGYQVFETIQKIPQLATTPFIFLSARTQIEDLSKGLQMGVDDYITKPFRLNELFTRVKKRIEKHETIKNDYLLKFDALANNPFVGLLIIQDDRIRYFNKKICELFEYKEDNVLNLDVSQAIFSQKTYYEIQTKSENSDEIVLEQAELLTLSGEIIVQKIYAKNIQFDNRKAILITINQNETIFSNVQIQETNYTSDFDKILARIMKLHDLDLANDFMSFTNHLSQVIKKEDILKKKLNISDREIDVLTLICQGYTNIEIGEHLFISPRTVDGHRNSLMLKIGAKNSAQLVAFAIKHKIVEL
ncbi:MAG: hypothetical protein RIS47_8 [Bacteroidota bacterium]|jgi:DNA-binding NarL/FixJ family response regulator